MWRALCTECAVHRLLSLLRFQNPRCQRATSTLSGPTRTDSKERIT
jgi:hypothetical protein